MRRDPRAPDLVEVLLTDGARAVEAVAVGVYGRAPASVLVSRRPWNPDDGTRDPIGTDYVSRLEFADPRAAVLVAENEVAGRSAVVTGPSGSVRVDLTATLALGRVDAARVRVVVTSQNLLEDSDPLSNADVADLTRRVYAASPELRESLSSRVLHAPLPVLSQRYADGELVSGSGGELGRAVLAALREVDSGIPLEWALRRLPVSP